MKSYKILSKDFVLIPFASDSVQTILLPITMLHPTYPRLGGTASTWPPPLGDAILWAIIGLYVNFGLFS